MDGGSENDLEGSACECGLGGGGGDVWGGGGEVGVVGGEGGSEGGEIGVVGDVVEAGERRGESKRLVVTPFSVATLTQSSR